MFLAIAVGVKLYISSWYHILALSEMGQVPKNYYYTFFTIKLYFHIIVTLN